MLALAHPDLFVAAASHSGVLSPMYGGPHPFAPPARYLTSIDSLELAWGGVWPSVAPAFGSTLVSWEARDPARGARSLKTKGDPIPALFVDVGTEDGLADHWEYWHAHVGESMRWLAERIRP